jgi:hypothetical protein
MRSSRLIRLAVKLAIVAILLYVPSRATAAQECGPFECQYGPECVPWGDYRTWGGPSGECPECEVVCVTCGCYGSGYDCTWQEC